MSGQPSIELLLQRNQRLSAWHRPQKYFAETNTPNKPKVAIISCLDPRSAPDEMFGLQHAEALSFRNVGGQVAPLLDELVWLDALLGFEHVLVVHHTDCALVHFHADMIRGKVQQGLPDVSPEEVGSLTLPKIDNLEESVLDNMSLLKESKFIRSELKDGIMGFVYDIKTGLVKEVK
jgi:carbonic anhydrase